MQTLFYINFRLVNSINKLRFNILIRENLSSLFKNILVYLYKYKNYIRNRNIKYRILSFVRMQSEI